MATVPKHVLDFWDAVDAVDPLPEPWRQTAMTCEMLSHVRATISAGSGVATKLQTSRDFMPPRAQAHMPLPNVSEAQSDEEMRSTMGRAYRGGA